MSHGRPRLVNGNEREAADAWAGPSLREQPLAAVAGGTRVSVRGACQLPQRFCARERASAPRGRSGGQRRPPGRQTSRVAIEPPAGQLAHPETRLLSTTLSPPGHVGQAHEVTGTSVADISLCRTRRRAGQAAARPQQPLDQATAPVAFGTVPVFVP